MLESSDQKGHFGMVYCLCRGMSVYLWVPGCAIRQYRSLVAVFKDAGTDGFRHHVICVVHIEYGSLCSFSVFRGIKLFIYVYVFVVCSVCGVESVAEREGR